MIIKKETRRTVIDTTTENIDLINKYFWESRSVFAVEFEFSNKEISGPHDSKMKVHTVKFIEIEFEKHLIHIHTKNFYETNGASDIMQGRVPNWVTDLWHNYVHDRLDTRTKEQFYKDYKATLDFLNSHMAI